MFNRRAWCAVASVSVLASCASGQSAEPDYSRADIANVASVKSSFGPEFHVTEVGPTGIDPQLFASQPMPPGVAFDPADCAKVASAQIVPPGIKGNMAATAAEGEGNRFITIAVETSEAVPLSAPGEACRKVGFTGGQTRGVVEVVEAPEIGGVRTIGSHRVVQTIVDGTPRTGELYNYVAGFGPFLVIVTANPLVQPGKPVAPVDTQRARELLSAAVAAVRG